MIDLIEHKRESLRQLCQEYRVRRLELFGSGSGEKFVPERSDLDFLVEYLPLRRGEYAKCYFGLLEGLQALFQRPVDLVMTRAVKNPYFLESVNLSRTVLYAA